MANEKQYLNGVFADKKNGNYGEYIDMHIPNLERFIENLRAFKTNSKGGIRFRITEKQAQNGEMSIYYNDWEPTGQPSIPQRTAAPSQAPKQQYAKPTQKQQPAYSGSNDDSQLPF